MGGRKSGCFAVHDVVCARLLPTLGADAGIMWIGLPDLGSPLTTDHDVECEATAILLRRWGA